MAYSTTSIRHDTNSHSSIWSEAEGGCDEELTLTSYWQGQHKPKCCPKSCSIPPPPLFNTDHVSQNFLTINNLKFSDTVRKVITGVIILLIATIPTKVKKKLIFVKH
jgi:hypothetical protein